MVKNSKRNSINKKPMIFGGLNYKLLVLGLFLVTAGFTAMYLEDKVRGFISLYISPIVIMAGYIMVIFSIMVNRSDERRAKPGAE